MGRLRPEFRLSPPKHNRDVGIRNRRQERAGGPVMAGHKMAHQFRNHDFAEHLGPGLKQSQRRGLMTIASRESGCRERLAKRMAIRRIHPRLSKQSLCDRSLDFVAPMEHDLEPRIGLPYVMEQSSEPEIPRDPSGKPTGRGETSGLFRDPLAMRNQRTGSTRERLLVILIGENPGFRPCSQPAASR